MTSWRPGIFVVFLFMAKVNSSSYATVKVSAQRLCKKLPTQRSCCVDYYSDKHNGDDQP
jgi:hypothetical protein